MPASMQGADFVLSTEEQITVLNAINFMLHDLEARYYRMMEAGINHHPDLLAPLTRSNREEFNKLVAIKMRIYDGS